ncbi:9-O-acetyl-N-acetylneuraminate esterase, partial [Candidatus Magnetomorum sp. HK-1]
MKRFNYTGTCIPEHHYMANIEKKIEKIKRYINLGEYFTINLPRQFGKTTSIFMLEECLKSKYLIFSTSFEGLGEIFFNKEEELCRSIIPLLKKGFISDDKDFYKQLQLID